MDLASSNGNRLTLSVTGYQFPDAEDPRMRYSWHMVGGHVECAEGSWDFRWQALTCDESPLISDWLRSVASAADRSCVPHTLRFTEPNLSFDAQVSRGHVTVGIAFDAELLPPWRPRRAAGQPYVVDFELQSGQLLDAADAWDTEVAAFPDRYPN